MAIRGFKQAPAAPAAGRVTRPGARVVIVASAFNKPVTDALVRGARQTLQRHGVPPGRISCLWVPGAFELPVAAAAVASKARPDAIVAVGCIIKGQTPQYAALGQAVMQALAQVAAQEKIPVGCGVVIADSVSQAQARAGGAAGNRGEEAALAAVVMMDVLITMKRHA